MLAVCRIRVLVRPSVECRGEQLEAVRLCGVLFDFRLIHLLNNEYKDRNFTTEVFDHLRDGLRHESTKERILS